MTTTEGAREYRCFLRVTRPLSSYANGTAIVRQELWNVVSTEEELEGLLRRCHVPDETVKVAMLEVSCGNWVSVKWERWDDPELCIRF